MATARFLSLPNVISLSRVVLAAAFVATTSASGRIVLIAAASATDFLDGWIARRRHIASRWGALVDPIADRVFVLVAVSSFLYSGALSTGQYFTLLARDIMTAVGFVVARLVPRLRPVDFQARLLGKLVTVLQLATLFSVLLYSPAVRWLVIAVGVTALASIVDYTVALWRARAA
jgi:phosphatidylglycerophosphate synthase